MMARPDLIFIERAVYQFWNEEFPEAGCSAVCHGMASAVPLVEVTYDTHSRGVWRPDNKMDPDDTFHCSEMGAHRFVSFEEGPFGEKMQFEVGEEGGMHRDHAAPIPAQRSRLRRDGRGWFPVALVRSPRTDHLYGCASWE